MAPTRSGFGKLILIVTTFGLLLVFSVVHAGRKEQVSPASPERSLSIWDTVSIALNRNYRIAYKQLGIKKQEHVARQAFSDFFPSLELDYTATGYKYQTIDSNFGYARDSRWQIRYYAHGFNYEEPLYPYRIDPFKSFELTATLTQPIFAGGSLLANYKYAQLGVQSAQLDLQIEQQDLILDVYKAYYNLVLAYKLREAAELSVTALRNNLRQTRAFYEADLVREVDVLASGGQLAQARITRRTAEKDIERYRAQLNLLLRYPQETPIRIAMDYEFTPAPYSIPAVYAIARANRLEIRKAGVSTQRARTQVKSAEANLMPTVDVKLEGLRVNDDWNVFDHDAYNDWYVEGVLTWTLNMFSNTETVKEDRVAHAQKFIDQRQTIHDVMEEVKEAYVDMKEAEGNIADNKQALNAYARNYEMNVKLYREQVSTYREVLDAERELATARSAYYRSLLNHKIYKAVLERKMGILR